MPSFRLCLLNIALLCKLVYSTVICDGCRPVEWQVSPGIGLDFTMSYGVAAVQFRNGTVLDVAKVNGPPKYREVMKQLADDVQNEQRGGSAKIPVFRFDRESPLLTFDPRWPDAYDQGAVQQMIKAAMKPFANFLAAPSAPKKDEPLPPPDEWTRPLHDMAEALKAKVFEVVPEAEKFAIASFPDALRVNNVLLPRVRHALQLAGLQEGGDRNPSHSIVAAYALKFGEHNEDRKFSDGLDTSRALFITHTETAMSLSDVEIDSETLIPIIEKRAIFVKPPTKHTKQQFVQNVRLALEQFVKVKKDGKEYLDLDHDEIILLGSLASQEELRAGIKLVFGDKIVNPKGKSKIRALTAGDEVYAAARGSALFARDGLQTAYISCLPNHWCPQPEPLPPTEQMEDGQLELPEEHDHDEL